MIRGIVYLQSPRVRDQLNLKIPRNFILQSKTEQHRVASVCTVILQGDRVCQPKGRRPL